MEIRTRQPSAPTGAAIAMGLLALLATACGGSPGSGVAQLGSTAGRSSTTTASGSPNGRGPTSSPSPASQLLAFSRCMRSKGVANFPDPNSSGVLPKHQIGQLAAGNPQFPAAHRACEHLLPNGGQPTPAQVQQAWDDMGKFALCMRTHGVPNWPAPSVTSPQDNRPFFNLPNGIDPNAPQVVDGISACQHVMHLNNPLVTTQ